VEINQFVTAFLNCIVLRSFKMSFLMNFWYYCRSSNTKKLYTIQAWLATEKEWYWEVLDAY